MLKESRNNFEDINYFPLDFNEMDVHNESEHRDRTDDGEDEFSTYFTDQKVIIPEVDKVM